MLWSVKPKGFLSEDGKYGHNFYLSLEGKTVSCMEKKRGLN